MLYVAYLGRGRRVWAPRGVVETRALKTVSAPEVIHGLDLAARLARPGDTVAVAAPTYQPGREERATEGGRESKPYGRMESSTLSQDLVT